MILRVSDLRPEVQARLANVRGRGDAGIRPRRVAGGRLAQRVGEAFQDVIMAAAAAQRHLLELDPLPPVGGRFRKGGEFHAEAICCDLIGTRLADGRAIYIEAKRVGPGTPGLDLGNPKIVKDHQRRFLVRHAAAGAIAGFMVEHDGLVRWLYAGYREVWSHRPKVVRWESKLWLVLGRRVDFEKLFTGYRPQPGAMTHEGEAWR